MKRWGEKGKRGNETEWEKYVSRLEIQSDVGMNGTRENSFSFSFSFIADEGRDVVYRHCRNFNES